MLPTFTSVGNSLPSGEDFELIGMSLDIRQNGEKEHIFFGRERCAKSSIAASVWRCYIVFTNWRMCRFCCSLKANNLPDGVTTKTSRSCKNDISCGKAACPLLLLIRPQIYYAYNGNLSMEAQCGRQNDVESRLLQICSTSAKLISRVTYLVIYIRANCNMFLLYDRIQFRFRINCKHCVLSTIAILFKVYVLYNFTLL